MNTVTPPHRILLGPGPTNVPYRVYRAMTTPITGHMDPEFLEIMAQAGDLLRYVFVTNNKITLPVSGTGSAGMEAALVNFLEPGDDCCVLVGGFFAQRMAEIASRTGANMIQVDAEWGKPIDPQRVADALRGRRPKVIAVVHGETSTGVLQPLGPLVELARKHDALLVVDAVPTLGGVPLKVDEMGIDVCYSGSQKCLSCPPGLAPITVSERGAEVLRNRKSKVQSWYFDLSGVEKYWGKERTYHHTAPITMIYALHEGLSIVKEEGLENRWAHHAHCMSALRAGLDALGMHSLPEPGYQMSSLAVVCLPEGVDDVRLRSRLLSRFNIEIAGGLGQLKGKILRIGLMGTSCSEGNALLLLSAMEVLLAEDGYLKASGHGAGAAQAVLAQSAVVAAE